MFTPKRFSKLTLPLGLKMYTRKSAGEIRNIKKQRWIKVFNPTWPLILSIFGTLIATPMIFIFGTKFNPPGSLIDNWPLVSFKIFVTSFLVVQLYQFLGRNYMGVNIVDGTRGFDYRVCSECKQPCHDSTKWRCKCKKGKLEPRLYYKKKN